MDANAYLAELRRLYEIAVEQKKVPLALQILKRMRKVELGSEK